MSGDTKIIGGIVLVSLAIVVGAVVFFGRTPGTTQNGGGADQSVLVRDNSYRQATDSAKALLVEFADYQCPACATYQPIVKSVLSDMRADITFVARHFPLIQHKNSRPAAYAAEAAGKQGKFWEMHEVLYDKQKEWEAAGNPNELFQTYATSLLLNTDTFAKDMEDKAIIEKVQRDINDGNQIGVNATPTFFLNGQKLESPASADEFKRLIADAIQNRPISQTPSTIVHIHTNFSVVLDGKRVDFSQSKYQSTEEKGLDSAIHVHDGVGDVMHIHEPNIALARFFSSLGMTLTDDCLTLDTKAQYCSDDTKKLQLFVNGNPQPEIVLYEPKDLDRILLRWGTPDQDAIDAELTAVTDTACIYSEKCPERGTPPTEECVGGLGSNCEKEE